MEISIHMSKEHQLGYKGRGVS